MRSRDRQQPGALLVCLALMTWGPARAEDAPRPLTPADDDQVLARLPAVSPELRARARQLREGTRAPTLALHEAVRLAWAHVERAQQEDDPRQLGYAQALLEPWWSEPKPPAQVLLVRSSIRQRRHDFEGAAIDLDLFLTAHPENAQAWFARATLSLVRGDLPAARESCRGLQGVASPLVLAACRSSVEGISDPGKAARKLDAELARSSDPHASLRAWVLTLAGELALRDGDVARAEERMREALTLTPKDPYLLGALADLLLDSHRETEVMALLHGFEHIDALLVRLARAEASASAPKAQMPAARVLRERFKAAAARGERIHWREESQFALYVEQHYDVALETALENWTHQREPIDLRLVLEAALAAKKPAAAREAIAWAQSVAFRDVRCDELIKALEARP